MLGQGSYEVFVDVGDAYAAYPPTYSPDCSGTISAGQTKTCTVTYTYMGGRDGGI